MLITLDNLAHRYQCLPSQALAQGTTFDLRVLEVSNRWQQRQAAEAQGQPVPNREPTQDEMMAMLARTRNNA